MKTIEHYKSAFFRDEFNDNEIDVHFYPHIIEFVCAINGKILRIKTLDAVEIAKVILEQYGRNEDEDGRE